MNHPIAPAAPPDPSYLDGPGSPPPPPPRPRRSGLTDWNSSFALIWGAGYGGIPAIILVVLIATMGAPWNDLVLDQRGVQTQATPYAIESTSVSVNDESVMRVRVRFRDRAGREHDAGLPTTDGPSLSRAALHQPVAIDYDPGEPELARLHGQSCSALGGGGSFVVPMLVIVFIIPGLSALVWGVLQLGKRRRIYRDGVAVVATVVEHTESASAENDEHLTNARYEFATPQGPASGTIKSLRPPPVGARLWVIYAPDQPSLNLPAF